MQIVVDASAILAVLLGEPHREAIIAACATATLCAPASLTWEVGNALSAALKRKRLDELTARRAVRAFDTIPIRWLPVDLETAVGLAAVHDLYAYDAYLLVTAQASRAPLLTLDRRLREVATKIRVALLEVEG
jgi:predicted nucleic acid-binding protein